MAYNPRGIFKEIETLLSVNPGLTLTALARDLAVDRHTIERSFRKAKGCTFRDYKHRKLVEEFLNLVVANENLTGKQIASCLGYRSRAAFSRFVKSSTGKTPTEIKNSVSSE
jgi:methylphosphotriester-DNA--protein-cysteine methyltransferase